MLIKVNLNRLQILQQSNDYVQKMKNESIKYAEIIDAIGSMYYDSKQTQISSLILQQSINYSLTIRKRINSLG